jgi:micrococcal nuclease
MLPFVSDLLPCAIMRVYIFALVAVCFLSCVPVEQNGKVVKVVDGDTFDIVDENRTTRIRLFGIDAPERGQAFNKRARAFMDSLVAGKQIRVVVRNKDRYGRTVGDAYLSDGTYVNAEIVRAGYAWQFRKYSTDPEVARLENAARSQRLGLWEDAHAIPPWEFRKGKR